MAYTERTLNTLVTTTLLVVQRDADGVETATDADATPTAEIRNIGVLVHEISADDVQHDGTGSYSFTWTPTIVGTHVITWAFDVGGESYESEEKVIVSADVEGVSDSDGPDAEASTTPDLGADLVCRVTGSFYDAAGNALAGVYVRFTVDRETTSFLASGIVASEVDAVSGDDGVVDFYLVRGLTGTLAVSGLGIVRQVTVPDVGAISLKDLVDTGDDLLEVQTIRFKPLPRRS